MDNTRPTYWLAVAGLPEWFIGWRTPDRRAQWRVALTQVFRFDGPRPSHVPALFLAPALHFEFDDDTVVKLAERLSKLKGRPNTADAARVAGLQTKEALKELLLKERAPIPDIEDPNAEWLSFPQNTGPVGPLPDDAWDGRGSAKEPRWAADILPWFLENWFDLLHTPLDEPLGPIELGSIRQAEPWRFFDGRLTTQNLPDLYLPPSMTEWERRIAVLSYLRGIRERSKRGSATRRGTGQGRRRGSPSTANPARHLSDCLLLRLLTLQADGKIPLRSSGVRRLYHTACAVLDPERDVQLDADDNKARQRAKRLLPDAALADGVAPLVIPIEDAASRIPPKSLKQAPTPAEALDGPMSINDDSAAVATFDLGARPLLARWAHTRLAKFRSSPLMELCLFVITGADPTILDPDDSGGA